MYKDLPLVRFEYPNSDTSYLKVRYVRVISMDQTHLRGREFDTAHPASNDEGKPKTYLLSKIVQNGVSLMEFSTE